MILRTNLATRPFYNVRVVQAVLGAFGLLVLGSPDPTRYSSDMGTEFLMRIGEIASAGLSRLLA
jgi:uncharacterized protein YigA (DUF484 family)